ncbi:MAG: sel1 repeat family protein [Alphaproteobacteria bacterium]|nr:sel1 repeat family protein [Alphaproteobacteria bacterium]
MTRLFPPSGSTTRGLVALLGLVLGPALCPAADDGLALEVSSSQVIHAAVASGLIGEADFETIDDPHVGPLLVGRPGVPDDPARTFSIILFGSESTGLTQIQFIMSAPWEGLSDRLELAASIASLVVTLPSFLPPMPPMEAGPASLTPMASWLYTLFYESWLGWPGSGKRLVRVRDDVAVTMEGTPPETWIMTLAVDRSFPDTTWPGAWSGSDTPGVTEARQLIRQGEYQAARDLLEPLAEGGDPQAALLMGDMARFGRIGIPHIEDATDWYLVAARHRQPRAIWALAAMLTEGWGTFFLNNLKGQLLARAEAAGSADALLVLGRTAPGVNYVRPPGVSASDQILEAARWGLLAAQHDIADRYARGDGVASDAVEACAWAIVALENTGPGADYIYSRQLLADLSSRLDETGLARARERAMDLVTGPPAWSPLAIE